MRILIVDGMGGGIGKALISAISRQIEGAEITAVGTNSAATAAMLKAGAHHTATGENAVVVCARRADVILGPLGIVVADSMLGEITPAMAAAIGRSDACRILLPVNHCNNIVAGMPPISLGSLVESAVETLKAMK